MSPWALPLVIIGSIPQVSRTAKRPAWVQWPKPKIESLIPT